ncbi:hypothetical protein IZY60_10845 [Lutibacter sp. B2]|nr:hypothetical protein [Lutibacter sp. B2]
MKKTMIITLILAMVMSFTGCANKEMKLYNAFQKTQEITSMESDTDITFNFDVSGLSEQEQTQVQVAKQMLKDSKISLHQKMLQNEDKTIAKAEVDADISVGGMAMNTKIWIDSDISGKIPKLVEIIKLPKMAMMSAPPEYQNKEYIVYNIQEIMNMDKGQQIDFNKLMSSSKELQPKLTAFLKDYALDFNPGFKIVDDKGMKDINGESVSVYELKLDDRAFKRLMRYSVNNLLENKEATKFIQDYMNTVLAMAETADVEKEVAKEEMNEQLNELQNNLPQMKEQFNQFMDTFEDVKILGDKGIVVEYAINKDGYIVNENSTIDLNIDLASLEKAFSKDTISVKKKQVFKLNLNFNTNIYNINKEIEINMPTLNQQNTLYLSDLIK